MPICGSDGRSVLLQALEDFHQVVRDSWIDGVEALGDGVDSINGLDFDIAQEFGIGASNWPTADSYPNGNGGVVQEVSYLVVSLQVTDGPITLEDEEWRRLADFGGGWRRGRWKPQEHAKTARWEAQ